MKTNKLTIGILAHVDAGKTTLSESILYETGCIKKRGRVDHQDAFLDTYDLEKARGITIFSKQAVFPLNDYEVTLLDTPGHVDFSAEMERTLRVLDYAVLVISGTDGVQGHTTTVWQLLKRNNVPTFIFVNKMDMMGVDKAKVLSELKTRVEENCVEFDGVDQHLFFDTHRLLHRRSRPGRRPSAGNRASGSAATGRFSDRPVRGHQPPVPGICRRRGLRKPQILAGALHRRRPGAGLERGHRSLR